MRKSLLSIALPTALALAACQPGAAPTPPAGPTTAPVVEDTATPVPAETPVPAAAADAATDTRSVLAGKVWRVTQRSDAAAAGTTYAFLEDGRLVVDDTGSTPMTGSWAVEGDKLSMTEEGVTYPTDLVVTDAEHIDLRSHNAGGVLALSLERATDVPLPE